MSYYLINIMQAVPGNSLGTVLSRHRSARTAFAADKSLQRLTERANGRGSYLPTIIILSAEQIKPGQHFPTNAEFSWETSVVFDEE